MHKNEQKSMFFSDKLNEKKGKNMKLILLRTGKISKEDKGEIWKKI